MSAIDPKKLDALIAAQKVLMVDRVRHLGQGRILSRQITLEAKETLREEMYRAYKALGGRDMGSQTIAQTAIATIGAATLLSAVD